MRVFLFAKFYEELLRHYFERQGFEVLPGKPKIFWNKIPFPNNKVPLRLAKSLKERQQSALYCIPDGLFRRGEDYYIWEAKNWVQDLFSSPFADRVWDFPWLLAREVEYRGQSYKIRGFVISWWDREQGMDEALTELRSSIYPLTVDIVLTKDVLQECITFQYDWYVKFIRYIRKNVDQFFDVLLGDFQK